jgi:predicted protein tyrosine phosphatase
VSDWFLTYGFGDVYDRLVIGAVPLDPTDVKMIARLGVTRVLNMVEDAEYPPGARVAVRLALEEAGIEEQRVSLVDYGHLPPEAIEQAVDTVNGWLDDRQLTYVHCRAGWQRSAAIAAGVVATRDHVDIDEALQRVNRRKPSADPLPHQRDDLRRWWEQRASVSPPAVSPPAE